MTAKAALIDLLLSGKVLNIKNCFSLIGITNCPREISRSVEKPFGVIVSRTQREGKSRYGQTCVWVDYKLNFSENNKSGIEKMKQYVMEQKGVIPSKPKKVYGVVNKSMESQQKLL